MAPLTLLASCCIPPPSVAAVCTACQPRCPHPTPAPLCHTRARRYGHPEVRGRAFTEDRARDSLENLLFGLCRFYELTGRYPDFVVVRAWGWECGDRPLQWRDQVCSGCSAVYRCGDTHPNPTHHHHHGCRWLATISRHGGSRTCTAPRCGCRRRHSDMRAPPPSTRPRCGWVGSEWVVGQWVAAAAMMRVSSQAQWQRAACGGCMQRLTCCAPPLLIPFCRVRRRRRAFLRAIPTAAGMSCGASACSETHLRLVVTTGTGVWLCQLWGCQEGVCDG